MALRMALPTTTVTVFRTETVVAAGGYGDSELAEDWMLAAAVALRGRVEQHARPGADVLLHRGSLFNRPLTRRQASRSMRDVRESAARRCLHASLAPAAARPDRRVPRAEGGREHARVPRSPMSGGGRA